MLRCYNFDDGDHEGEEASASIDHAKALAMEAERMPRKPKAFFPVFRHLVAIEKSRGGT